MRFNTICRSQEEENETNSKSKDRTHTRTELEFRGNMHLILPFASTLCISNYSSRITRSPKFHLAFITGSCEIVECFAIFEVSDRVFGYRERGEVEVE